ncbi:MAG: hypothetical protein CFE32_05540 [Alphaproteobacteria bacterium PA3]|nr:MAG: hypothetical protein CFE32_05540 [Alphaproteobacteria bacterium PA3]
MMVPAFDMDAPQHAQMQRLITLENICTPTEFLEIASRPVPSGIAPMVALTATRILSLHARPKRFQKIDIAADVTLIKPVTAVARRLVVCFCGGAHRLMLPLPVFLQIVPEDQFDLLILRDRSRRLYLGGATDLGKTFAETLSLLSAFIMANGYQETRCYGVSSGGAPALYAATALGAGIGLSISGKHPTTLLDDIQFPEGFDGMELDMARAPAALPQPRPDLKAIFGAGCPRDHEGAKVMASHLTGLGCLALDGCADHNINAWLLEKAALSAFHQQFLFRTVIS